MEKLLELAKKNCDWAEVFYIKKGQTSVNFKSAKVYNIEEEIEEGITLRIRKNGKTGFTSSTNIKNRENILEMAMNVLSVNEEAPFETPDFNNLEYPPVKSYDDSLAKISEEEMLKTGEKIINLVKEKKPATAITGEIGKTVSNIRLINSTNLDRAFSRTFYSAVLNGTVVDYEEQLEIESSFSSGYYVKDLTPLSLKLVEDISSSERQGKIKSGPMDVIFSPRGFKTLYPPLYMAFSGDRAGTKTSPIYDRIGEKAGPEFLSIVDDKTVPFGPLSAIMDDEGIPAQRTELITNGIIKDFYYDLKSASQYNKKSTGNGMKRASLYEGFKISAQPSCYPGNFMILPGDKKKEDLMKSVKRALIVEDVLGAGQANNLGGEFRVNVLLGFLWEDGEIKGRVKDVMISGNVFELLKNLQWTASDSIWEHSYFGIYNVPTMCFSDINVVAKD